jgi:ribonuclease Z
MIFLGTGSMMPATFRNVSAINLTANNRYHILLDCGEGTFSQLIDQVGLAGIDDYLKDLRVIYITHIHPDHNLGLFKILAERKALEQRTGQPLEPIFVIMPRNTLILLLRFARSVEGLNCHLISCQDLITFNSGEPIQPSMEFFGSEPLEESENDMEGDQLKALVLGQKKDSKDYEDYSSSLQENLKLYTQWMQQANLKTIQPVRVLHCPQSHGVVITSNYGWRVSYSGDCRPTQGLVQEGKGSTVLIHEATFQSSHGKQAKEKMHSTIEEAITMGIKMDAKRTCLTHFSQRYTISETLQKKRKPMDIQEENPAVRDYLAANGVMALDHLRFKMSQLSRLPMISPAFNFGVSDDN